MTTCGGWPPTDVFGAFGTIGDYFEQNHATPAIGAHYRADEYRRPTCGKTSRPAAPTRFRVGSVIFAAAPCSHAGQTLATLAIVCGAAGQQDAGETGAGNDGSWPAPSKPRWPPKTPDSSPG